MNAVLNRRITMMRHALGLDNSESGVSYRNRYTASRGTPDHLDWDRMVEQHLAAVVPMVKPEYPFDHYRLTREGAEMALMHGEKLDQEDFPPFKQVH